jgi:hypothetical protein
MVDGNNFGLNGSYEYNEFVFDSLDCDQAANANALSSDWPRFYFGKPVERVAAIKVLNASIPRTYYDLENPTQIYVTEYNGTTANFTITIPAGTYTGEDFATVLAELLTQNSAHTYTATYNTYSGKIHVSSNYNNTGNYFTFNLNGDTFLATLSGFNSGLNTSSEYIDPKNHATLISPNVGRFDTLTHLFLCSNSLGPKIDMYLPGNGFIQPAINGADGPQVAKIPINAKPFETIHYTDPDPQKWFAMNNLNLNSSVDFYFTMGIHNTRTYLKFNGRGFSLKLGVLFTKEENTDVMKSIASNKRVASRTWPTSGVAQF